MAVDVQVSWLWLMRNDGWLALPAANFLGFVFELGGNVRVDDGRGSCWPYPYCKSPLMHVPSCRCFSMLMTI